jgi:hypothetical protein
VLDKLDGGSKKGGKKLRSFPPVSLSINSHKRDYQLFKAGRRKILFSLSLQTCVSLFQVEPWET